MTYGSDIKVADSSPAKGNNQWRICDDTLYIRGNGSMKDFGPGDEPPWKDHEFRSAEIMEGVTSLGANSLPYPSLESVTIPNSLEQIGAGALCGSGVREIRIPSRVSQVGPRAFYKCRNLDRVEFISELHDLERDPCDLFIYGYRPFFPKFCACK